MQLEEILAEFQARKIEFDREKLLDWLRSYAKHYRSNYGDSISEEEILEFLIAAMKITKEGFFNKTEEITSTLCRRTKNQKDNYLKKSAKRQIQLYGKKKI